MKIKTILIGTLLINTVLVSAQTIANRSELEIINYDVKKPSAGVIDGTPYLSDAFSVSKINKVTSPIETRYNTYTDEIEFKTNGNIYVLPKDEIYNTISQNNGTTIKLINGSYYILLSELPKFNLLSKEKTSIDKNETTVKNGYAKEENPSYVREKSIYYILYKETLIQVDKNFEALKNSLSKKEVNDYIKKNKPSIKDRESMLDFINFLNTVNLD